MLLLDSTGGFPSEPARFEMRRSDGPVDFLDIHKVQIGNFVDFHKDLWITSLQACG